MLDSLINKIDELENINENIKFPILDEKTFELLPKVLYEIVNEVDDIKDKNVILLSSIVVISSLTTNYHTNWFKRKILPNLSLFLIGKSGVGKGVMNYPISLINSIVKRQNKSTKNLTEQYYNELEKYNKRSKKDDIKRPIVPKIVNHKISGDISSAQLTKELENNDGEGLIIANEIDVLTKNKSNDWGDISVLIRAAFHNEEFSSSRKGKGVLPEKIYIKNVKLSILASGTPEQLFRFYPNITDGSYSRSLIFSLERDFKPPTIQDIKGNDLESIFETRYSSLMDDLYSNNNDIFVDISDELLEKLIIPKITELSDYLMVVDDDTESLVKRLGVSMIKIIMTLTALRNHDKLTFGKVEIDERDVIISSNIVSVLSKHMYSFYKTLDVSEKINIKKYDHDNLFDDLTNDIFETKDFRRLVKEKLNLSNKTSSRLLKKWISKGKLIKIKHGFYQKKLKNNEGNKN